MSSRTARKTPSRRAVVLRNVGFVIAVALGGVGIWLIVTGGDSTQRIEIGVLTGLWGLLLGAICGRRLVLAEPPAPPAPASSEAAATNGSTELAVPESAEVERVVAAAAQRAFASELQEMLRREFASAVDEAVAREVSELRAEIAELRQELLDKVGGQLRLERIETTRLIGSDLEAMRAEVRRLKSANEPAMLAGDLDLDLDEQADVVATPGRVVDAGPETARIPRIPAADGASEAESAAPAGAEPAPQTPAAAEPTRGPAAAAPEPAAAAASAPAAAAAPEPAAAEAPEPAAPEAPEPAAAEAPEPAVPAASTAPPVPAGDSDPFAGLPRLSPFTDFVVDPVEGEHAQADSESHDPATEPAEPAEPTEPASTPAAAATRAARHRRRRSDDPAGEQLLAQLLAREGVRR